MSYRLANDGQSDESWASYERLFLPDATKAMKLRSAWTNDEWLDAMSAPKFDHSAPSKKAPVQKIEPEIVVERIEISDDPIAPRSKSKGKQKS